MLYERINELYRKALREKLYITNQKELSEMFVVSRDKFSLSKLKYTVQELEKFSFVDGKNSFDGKDILGDFFEGIIRDGFKQSKGQFFTHINIVRFMLWGVQADRLAIEKITQDKLIPYMIDPSAGSGTFLIEYMKFITSNMKYRLRNKLGSARGGKNSLDYWFESSSTENKWAKDFIYGIEPNPNLGKATKVNMILHGDGSTNIFIRDGLYPFEKYRKDDSRNVLDKASKEEYYSKHVNEQFDLILTNPPFSVPLENDTKKLVEKVFLYGDKNKSENLFIERHYKLLKEYGRLAIILPDNIFDTTENKYIRLFLYKYFNIKAIVSLPQTTFAPYTPTKTSVLFAQKKSKKEVNEWNKIWKKYSDEWSKLVTRIENIIAVYAGKKKKERLSSIKNLSEKQEKELIIRFLKHYLSEEEKNLSKEELIIKYS